MQLPKNEFKAALRERGKLQIGLWVGLVEPCCAEICAGAGFDWLLLDGEHAPNDVRTLLAQMQAMAPYPAHPVVRPVTGDVNIIKQLVDAGARTLLIPMVESAEQARALVAATRYPPQGIRGVGTTLARAARWDRYPRYLYEANDEMCLLVQVETRQGLENLNAIAAVEGVDGVFIGPSDLSAALGHLGEPGHPEVQAVIADAIGRILACGKPAGILAVDDPQSRRYIELGCTFVAVGIDAALLKRATEELAARFKPPLKS
jgi:4-hydroxy-2-oxoheptanedioate aldolase